MLPSIYERTKCFIETIEKILGVTEQKEREVGKETDRKVKCVMNSWKDKLVENHSREISNLRESLFLSDSGKVYVNRHTHT